MSACTFDSIMPWEEQKPVELTLTEGQIILCDESLTLNKFQWAGTSQAERYVRCRQRTGTTIKIDLNNVIGFRVIMVADK